MKIQNLFLKLFFTFLKIGAFTFGGGYAMLPLIQEEVRAQGWLTDEELLNFIAVSESTPGPFAVNISTYVGMEAGGLSGAFFATLGVILPSFVILLILAKHFERFQKSRLVKGCMAGLKPAVIGLIAASVFSNGKAVLFPDGLSSLLTLSAFLVPMMIFLVILILALKKVHPILLILLSGIAGILAGLLSGG